MDRPNSDPNKGHSTVPVPYKLLEIRNIQKKTANPGFSPERFSTPHRDLFGCVGNPHSQKGPFGARKSLERGISFKRENLCEENLTDSPFCLDVRAQFTVSVDFDHRI